MSAEPDSEHDPEARVRRIMTVFYPDLICPAEMWWQVLEALGPPEHLTMTLESFSPELKAMIRDYYRVMHPPTTPIIWPGTIATRAGRCFAPG